MDKNDGVCMRKLWDQGLTCDQIITDQALIFI
jgi:hypothetical protein